MELVVKRFSELTNTELYEILKSRAEIFIKEQNINYQDMDDIDYQSLHIFYKENDKVVAYMRAFYHDEEKQIVKVGRILSLTHGCGLGKLLLENGIKAIKKELHPEKICMHAQKHAQGFYEKFGFVVSSDEFLEEGVVHIAMELVLKK